MKKKKTFKIILCVLFFGLILINTNEVQATGTEETTIVLNARARRNMDWLCK